ncbi:hypothetical protein BM536_030575 [Streptomyces phaeoluteigriseus]|uniref:Uncharacterized protein n=1 Tax=Streptomyces phaeoluteigriseus TaxID=114686 RepID=A0A1V6MJ70_9ACTN|nr:hypothetical protein BM536_030575 [Streptomyces phaeoluteigriseus]
MVAAVEAGGHLDAFVALVVPVVAVIGALRYGGVRLARGSGPEALREVLDPGRRDLAGRARVTTPTATRKTPEGCTPATRVDMLVW